MSKMPPPGFAHPLTVLTASHRGVVPIRASTADQEERRLQPPCNPRNGRPPRPCPATGGSLGGRASHRRASLLLCLGRLPLAFPPSLMTAAGWKGVPRREQSTAAQRYKNLVLGAFSFSVHQRSPHLLCRFRVGIGLILLKDPPFLEHAVCPDYRPGPGPHPALAGDQCRAAAVLGRLQALCELWLLSEGI